MNKFIILLPAFFIAGSISSVNATENNINKINIIENNNNMQLPTDEEGIHNLIFDKEKFEANKEKIFEYVANYDNKNSRDIYCQEITKLMMQEKSIGNDDFIDKLISNSKLTKGIVYMTLEKGFIKEINTEDCLKNDYEKPYKLLRYIITKSSIKDNNELINHYIEKIFSNVFSHTYDEIQDGLNDADNSYSAQNSIYNSEWWDEDIVNFFDEIVNDAEEDQKDGILVLQKVLEYMYQYFYEPYKEFINNNLDINKSPQFKRFAKEVFGNYDMMYLKEFRKYDTEKYASNTYNSLLMLFIYNRLVISFANNKLKLIKPSVEYFKDKKCKTEYLKGIFDTILELQKESNNKTNKMLISFYLKALFMRIYNDDDVMSIVSDLFKAVEYKNIYNLLNEYQMNYCNVCDEYNKIRSNSYDKRTVYYLKYDFNNDDYYRDNSFYKIGCSFHYVYYNDYDMLLVDDIKLLLNFFDKARYYNIETDDMDQVTMPPLTYITLITEQKSYPMLNTRSYSDEDELWNRMTKVLVHGYKYELKYFNRKVSNVKREFEEIGKQLGYSNCFNNKESNKIEKNNNIIEEELVKIDKNSALDKIMNDKNFINEIQTTKEKEYENIKLTLSKIAKYKNDNFYMWEQCENLGKLGLNIVIINKPVKYGASKQYKVEVKHKLETYISECINFYNRLISNEKQHETELYYSSYGDKKPIEIMMNNNMKFINQIMDNKYSSIKCTIKKIGKTYDKYTTKKSWENYSPIINDLKKLGYDECGDYKYRNECAKKCSEIYNKYLSLENAPEVNEENNTPKVKLIDQILRNKNFVYEVIANEYTDVEYKLRRIIAMSHTRKKEFNPFGNPYDKEMTRILQELGGNNIDVKQCVEFYNKLLDAQNRDPIDYTTSSSDEITEPIIKKIICNKEEFMKEIIKNKNKDIEQILRDINIDYEYTRDSSALSDMELVKYDMKRLGYDENESLYCKGEKYSCDDCIKECASFYKELELIKEKTKAEIKSNKQENKLDNKIEEKKNEIIDNDVNKITDNQIINQIIANEDFVYLVVGEGKYKEIGEKLKNLNTKYQDYCNNKSSENMRPVFRELMTLGYNSQVHGDWEECVKKCMNFKEQLDALANANEIA